MKLKQNILTQKEKLKLTDNERWLSDGDCSKWRRANYCSKDCTATKHRKEQIIEQAYRDVLHEKYPELEKVLDAIPKYDERGQKL